MDSKALLILLIPLIALAMILCWMALLARAGRPIKINLAGFGVKIALDSNPPTTKEKGPNDGLSS